MRHPRKENLNTKNQQRKREYAMIEFARVRFERRKMKNEKKNDSLEQQNTIVIWMIHERCEYWQTASKAILFHLWWALWLFCQSFSVYMYVCVCVFILNCRLMDVRRHPVSTDCQCSMQAIAYVCYSMHRWSLQNEHKECFPFEVVCQMFRIEILRKQQQQINNEQNQQQTFSVVDYKLSAIAQMKLCKNMPFYSLWLQRSKTMVRFVRFDQQFIRMSAESTRISRFNWTQLLNK